MYDLQNLIDRTIKQGKKTYLNPEKIKEFEKMEYDIGVDIKKYKEKIKKIENRKKDTEIEK